MQRASSADAMRPLAAVARLCLTLLVMFFVWALLFSRASGGHFTLGAWGSSDGCALVPQGGLPFDGQDPGVMDLQRDAYIGSAQSLWLCQHNMPAATRALFSVPTLTHWAWILGFFFLILNLTRSTRRHGLFTRPVAGAMSQVGRYLLAGWFIVAVIQAICYSTAIPRLVYTYSASQGFVENFHWSWGAIIGGLAAISMGRVMRQAIPMREDVEATV